jgi:hypothetical protein
MKPSCNPMASGNASGERSGARAEAVRRRKVWVSVPSFDRCSDALWGETMRPETRPPQPANENEYETKQ